MARGLFFRFSVILWINIFLSGGKRNKEHKTAGAARPARNWLVEAGALEVSFSSGDNSSFGFLGEVWYTFSRYDNRVAKMRGKGATFSQIKIFTEQKEQTARTNNRTNAKK